MYLYNVDSKEFCAAYSEEFPLIKVGWSPQSTRAIDLSPRQIEKILPSTFGTVVQLKSPNEAMDYQDSWL